MDQQFAGVRSAAYAGDFEKFAALLEKDPALITAPSLDRGDSPNLIQFIIVEGGLGKIPRAAEFLSYLIRHDSTTDAQLVAAASVNARDLVDVLLDAGVPLDQGAPWSAVEESLYWGHAEMASYLVDERGAAVNTLCACAMTGNIERLASFFPDDVLAPSVLPIWFPWGPIEDSTEVDALGQALILSLRHRQYEAAQFLLDHGADINAVPRGNHEECAALHQAADRNDIEMVDWLIDRGASGDVKDKRFGGDAMGWAHHAGHTEMVEHLSRRLSAPG